LDAVYFLSWGALVVVAAFEFGDFKLDCDRFELYRDGRSLKLERKPMELLILLAARNGHLVTRNEIADRLWDREVFVDTEHGINTAIRKIRQVLGDDIEQPRFLLTVTGKGYRFIGTIVQAPQPSADQENPPSPPGNGNANQKTAEPPSSSTTVAVPGSAEDRSVTPQWPETSHSNKSRLLVWLAALAGTAALAFFIVVGLRAGGWKDRFLSRRERTEIKSLAVLPLDNLSGDPGQEYFADGMTDELITMLAKNSTLRITSRTSIMQYKRVHRPLREIAGELGVDGILEGSVSRSGDKVHMTIQLIQAPSDTHVWADSYDRNPNDVASIPREAAQAIAKRLNCAVLQPAPAHFVSPEAHDAYLRGRYLWFSRNYDEAVGYFNKATKLQPDYAAGWTGLADYYGAGSAEGKLDPRESLAKQEAAARKAVELDDTLPEAHLSLGAAMFFKWDWARAEQEVSRAIELNPRFAEAYSVRSMMRIALNRPEEAIEAKKKSMELDPFARPADLAFTYSDARQYDAALNEAHMRLETLPQNMILHFALSETYRRKGALKDAAQEWEKVLLIMGDKESAASVRRNFEEGGYKAVIRWRLSQLQKESARHYVSPVDLAQQYAQLGRREETLDLLEEGYRQHSPWILFIQSDSAYDFLHSDPRYRAIIKQVGLPPSY
jgi:TolB-like protein/DNA-binding winged helix-turn-helix (wHTH) protein